ncbi:MAG: tetratricopeptide repeat protein [Elusimicrobia bacterium]|nr:tetratricopeptide repeat protein [Elusimicrobiota bacterium]
MMKYVLCVLALAGGYYYLSRHASLEASLQYVTQHKGASWAPRANYTIGWIYHQREEYGKAEAAFTQLLTDYPTGQFAAPALVYLEDSAESVKDWDAAKAALDRYIEEHPDGAEIKLMRERREMLHYHHGL